MINLTLDEVLDSKTYVKENSMVKFEPPSEYISPFVDEVSRLTDNFRVQAIQGSVNQEKTGEKNIAYSRVLIEALMPSKYDITGQNDKESAQSVVGMVYALDVQKPVVKVYSGKNVYACTNLCIFNADNLYRQELTGGRTVYKKAKEYTDTMEADVQEFIEICEKLKNNHYAGDELNKKIGELLKDSFRYKMSSYVTRGVQLMLDSKTMYALDNGSTSEWNFYNAITEIIKSDKNISDRADKVVNLSRMFIGKN